MRSYPYYTCDVFTDQQFGGNPLAVLPDAEGLDDDQMLRITREFNYAETTFVLPSAANLMRRVRIFTPNGEIPFAGHPNLGTAAMLAAHGHFGDVGQECHVTFEQGAGPVQIRLERRPRGRFWGELVAPASLTLGAEVDVAYIAAAASLNEADIEIARHYPHGASVGLSFLVAELRDVDALQRARPNVPALDHLASEAVRQPYLYLYARSDNGVDLRARHFCSSDPSLEDAATGSAGAALAGLMAHYDPAPEGMFSWKIAQGEQKGRPSLLEARAEKREGRVMKVWIAGESVAVAQGTLNLEN